MQEAAAVLDGPLCSGPKAVEFFIHSFTLSRISNLLLESRDASRNIPFVLSKSKAPGAIKLSKRLAPRIGPEKMSSNIRLFQQPSLSIVDNDECPHPNAEGIFPAKVTQQHIFFSRVYRLLLPLNRHQLSYLKC